MGKESRWRMVLDLTAELGSGTDSEAPGPEPSPKPKVLAKQPESEDQVRYPIKFRRKWSRIKLKPITRQIDVSGGYRGSRRNPNRRRRQSPPANAESAPQVCHDARLPEILPSVAQKAKLLTQIVPLNSLPFCTVSSSTLCLRRLIFIFQSNSYSFLKTKRSVLPFPQH